MASDPFIASFRHVLLDRRTFLMGTVLALAGCTATTRSPRVQPAGFSPEAGSSYAAMYADVPNERFPIPALDVGRIDPQYLRQIVPYVGPERPGTIIVDPHARFLYLVMKDGQAMRYGVGVGRAGFAWEGRATIKRKAKWPTWTPTRAMIGREPKLAKYANGMQPGLDNPLGARALYLYQGGRDTLYRIHGTNEPWSIGKAVSSGCIRMFNQDAIDLYNRTPTGAEVVVLQHGGSPSLVL